MKHLLLAGMMSLVLVSTAAAQNDPQIVSYLDSPVNYGQLKQTMPWFTGWDFHCAFGSQVQSLRVFYQADDASWVEVHPFARTGLNEFYVERQYRPDVRAAFLPWCPQLNDYLGFGFTLREVPPLGLRAFQVIWAVVGFFIGLPKEMWIGVAVIVAGFGLYYLHRQIALGKIREQAKNPAPQSVTATSEVSVS